ncbi:fibronectin type-III domain-containing protein [Paenibacillus sp. 32O-W]|uniref:Ig-like domain-containing protein n=1 Tax=Paenibacillus sp. 32O-W TaxID=1695218 RepID=UPI0007218E08|nr:Ig-like domain-containing protein [Paenibacillus sp. 32O-W]ALS30169.1 fibronectin type-III domain-containing protein [Paenibacillus sp. 32O-W]
MAIKLRTARTGKSDERVRRIALLLFAVLLVLTGAVAPAQSASAEQTAVQTPQLTIDTHTDGASVAPGIVRIGGTYTNVYAIELIVNAGKLLDAHLDDPDGDDSGVWYAEWNAAEYDGAVELVARGVDAATRYAAWSEPVRVSVDNPRANIPDVTIVSPADGGTVGDSADIRVAVSARNRLKQVQVRVNGGPWRNAAQKQDGTYVVKWNFRSSGERYFSIEARATDAEGNVGRSLSTYVRTAGAVPEPTPARGRERSMWIWENASYNLILNPGSRHVLDAMASDTATFGQEPVRTLYLGIAAHEGIDIAEDERQKLRDFVSWAHGRGYRVEALIAGGTVPPFFGAYERYRKEALREFEKVLNYNLSSAPDERFDGVNVDTEPYILADFKTGYPRLQIEYLDMLAALMERKEASGLGLSVGPAIPRWYDSSPTAEKIVWNGQEKWLSEHIQDIADYIAIMDYRDQAEGSPGIIAQAQGEIDYANAIGKPNSVVIGVETKDIADGGDPETISFREEGRDYMERELDKVEAAFGDSPSFGGIALHHYDTLRELPSAWGPEARFWQPPADSKPPSRVGWLKAEAFDHQRIDIAYGRAKDNGEVKEYRIYRGTEPGFPADEAHLAGTARGLNFRDQGLLPGTTYYYKVSAVDMAGNEGPVSAWASASTGQTSLKPMIVQGMSVAYDGSRATVTLRVVDLETGEPVPATVHGRFTFMGGRYISAATGADGVLTASSEAVSAVSGEIGFAPRRVMAAGYYWAGAYDDPREASAVWGP